MRSPNKVDAKSNLPHVRLPTAHRKFYPSKVSPVVAAMQAKDSLMSKYSAILAPHIHRKVLCMCNLKCLWFPPSVFFSRLKLLLKCPVASEANPIRLWMSNNCLSQVKLQALTTEVPSDARLLCPAYRKCASYLRYQLWAILTWRRCKNCYLICWTPSEQCHRSMRKLKKKRLPFASTLHRAVKTDPHNFTCSRRPTPAKIKAFA